MAIASRYYCLVFIVLVGLFSFVIVSTNVSVDGRPATGAAKTPNHVSPSGAFALFVDPADRFGHGAATYRFLENGKEIWSGDRDYALRDVSVTNDGFVIGIVYRSDADPAEANRGGESLLHVIILDKTGSEILNDEHRRYRNLNSHSPHVPYVEQLIVSPESDAIIVRAVECDQDSPVRTGRNWWTYQMSTGELIARTDSLLDSGA